MLKVGGVPKMCNQCPTVGEFICSILRCGCRNNCDKRPEHRCEHNCEHKKACEEKHYDCVCQVIKETESCYKPEKKEHDCSDCRCKYY